MTFIVESGVGLTNAESYISVDEATTYHNSRGNEEAWDAVEDKEAALRKATDYLRYRYGNMWAGNRLTATQALDWPRQNVRFYNGYAPITYRDSTVIPVELKNATAELALKSVTVDLLADLGRETLSEHVGEISVTYAPGSSRQTRFAVIEGWLSSLFGTSGFDIPIVRS